MKKIKLLLLIGFSMVSSMAFSQTVDVTFRVDMQDQTVDPNGVHVAGSFQGWNSSANPLNPLIGDVWETTIQINAGETIQYKFINGNTWGGGADESVYGSCGDGGGNRNLTIPAIDTTLMIVCFGSCTPCVVPQVDITFEVDMTNETVSPDGVHVAGSFQGWDPTATLMTDMGNNIYAVTVLLGIGEYHEYKFLNGNAWGTQEIVPVICGVDDGNGAYNRFITIPGTITILPEVCFSNCDPCSALTDINVTFQVDMSNETVSPEGVHIAGVFQGWDPAGTIMTDIGGGIWSYTTILTAGNNYEYKFVNGITWDDAEDVPASCNQNDNRFINVPDSDTTLIALCFASCNICNPTPVDVTFTVDLSTQNISNAGIYIVGSFNNWDTTATQLTNTSGNYYEAILTLGENDYHEFKYLNGNTFASAEFVPGECNSYDGNRFLTVPGISAVLDTVCFAECDACVNRLYTFNLDVFLEGPFNGTTMDTDLHSSDNLPTNQPYNTSPWNYDGTETQSIAPEIEAVDWLLIEFRETDGDASTATPDKFLDHQAAILLSDGSIVKPDGINSIQLTADITENIYVIIYHRNHLAVMSSSGLVSFGSVFAYNFTQAISNAYLDGQKDLGGGYFGMIGGDSDGSGTIDADDKDVNWNGNAGNTGYFGSDLNLDSEVDNMDKNDIWESNNEISTQIPNVVPFNSCGDIYTDPRNNQQYPTVEIGTQCWMAKNLNIGIPVTLNTDQTDNSIIEKYCFNELTSNCDEYGGLYQWDEMMDYTSAQGGQGICPEGWHVPTAGEWTTLATYLGGDLVAGGKIKETGLNHWMTPNTGATNETGFTDIGSGRRNMIGYYHELQRISYKWSSSSTGVPSQAYYRGCAWGGANLNDDIIDKANGISLRCIKDQILSY